MFESNLKACTAFSEGVSHSSGVFWIKTSDICCCVGSDQQKISQDSYGEKKPLAIVNEIKIHGHQQVSYIPGSTQTDILKDKKHMERRGYFFLPVD